MYKIVNEIAAALGLEKGTVRRHLNGKSVTGQREIYDYLTKNYTNPTEQSVCKIYNSEKSYSSGDEVFVPAFQEKGAVVDTDIIENKDDKVTYHTEVARVKLADSERIMPLAMNVKKRKK